MASETVLVVDDEPMVLSMVARLLEVAGYATETADNALEGLQALEQTRPSLVITDASMPEMDGYELCRRVREVSDVPVMMLSGYPKTRETVNDKSALPDDFVAKPVAMGEFLKRVDALLQPDELVGASAPA